MIDYQSVTCRSLNVEFSMPLPLTIRRIPRETAVPGERTLRGTFTGVASPGRLPADCLVQLIPRCSGIVPIEEPREEFPVWFLFGHQHNVRNVWGSLEFQYGFGLEYEEVILLIPDLKVPAVDDREEVPRVTLYSRIYLSSLMSMALGRFIYGFAKHHARFISEGHEFVTFDRHGNEVFHAEYELNPASVSTEAALDVKTLLETPVVFAGRQRRAGQVIVRHFEYDVSPERMTPVEVDLKVDHLFMKKFDTIRIHDPGLEETRPGAFHCEFPWCMKSALPAA